MDDDRAARRSYYITLLRMRYSGLTARDRRRLRKIDPLTEFALQHLIDGGLIDG